MASLRQFTLFACLLTSCALKWKRGDADEELAMRVSQIQTRMAEAEMDAVFLASEANIRYFTGWHSPFWASPTRPFFLVIPSVGRPIAVVPSIAQDAMLKAHTQKVVTWPAPRPDDEGVTDLIAVFTQDVLHKHGRIGAELGHEMSLRMPALDFLKLKEGMEEHSLVFADAGPILRAQRLVKSPQEVAKMEAACNAVSKTYDAVPKMISEGMSEAEACSLVKRMLLASGADDTQYVICKAGRGSYSDIISHPTDRKLARGDVLFLDTGSTVDGYYCDHNRNFAIGEPLEEALEVHRKLYDAIESALSVVRPGITFADIFHAMAKTLELEGDFTVGRMGHSVGLQLTEGPSIQPRDDTVLAEGMVIAIEPSMALPGGDAEFMALEEDVVITKSGYRLISKRSTRELPVVRRLIGAPAPPSPEL